MIGKTNIIVVKKSGREVEWNPDKIKKAVTASANHIDKEITNKQLEQLLSNVKQEIYNLTEPDKFTETLKVKVDLLHILVQNQLSLIGQDIYMSYRDYRNYKIEQRKSYNDLFNESDKLTNGTFTENANKDSAIISTKRSLLVEMTTKRLMNDFILPKKWKDAHNEGWIYIHDLGDLYWQTFNCDNVDVGRILRNKKQIDGEYAFMLNGIKYVEPSGILSAFNLFGDITLSMSSQQFGGFSVQNVDKIFAPYAEKTYQSKLDRYLKKGLGQSFAEALAEEDTIEYIKQGVQGYEFKISTVSNALGQTPFTTIGFGLDTSKWGREITKAILKERSKPESTFVFPKLVFASSKHVNTEPGTPNYDLFQKAVKCSSKKLYPDYVSMDEGILAPAFNRHQDDLDQTLTVGMGCRSYNSTPFINPVESDENYMKESYIGRGNVGVVTLNIVKMAIEANGDWQKLEEYITYYTNMTCDILNWRYNYVGKAYAESNPLMWTAGGAWARLEPHERISKLIYNFSASIGVIGLNEAMNAMYLSGYSGKYNVTDLPKYEVGGQRQNDQKRILELLNRIKSNRNQLDSVRITSTGKVEPVYINGEYTKANTDTDYITVFDELDTSKRITEIKRGYSIYGTPAETLVYRFMKQLQKTYGLIPSVTAKNDGTMRNYLTNSWHVPVWEDIVSFDKLEFEAPFHLDGLASGGHIGYTEHPYGTSTSVLEQLVRFAMERGMYYGINMASSTCFNCKWVGETADECPECGSHNVVTIQRTCGYLTITSRNGKAVSNLGKQEEYLERVNHSSSNKSLNRDSKKDYTKQFEENHNISDLINQDFTMFN